MKDQLAKSNKSEFTQGAYEYIQNLQRSFSKKNMECIEKLAKRLLQAWINGNYVYICGNGGSAANAIHIANDLHYGIGACGPGAKKPGIKIEALSANTGIITCLANDTGYDNIYGHQIEVKGRENDVLIALSGSGNSQNIVKALEVANRKGLNTFAIVAFKGGNCKKVAQEAIHFEVNDMQVAEDTQLIIGHLCMQWLNKNKPEEIEELELNRKNTN